VKGSLENGKIREVVFIKIKERIMVVPQKRIAQVYESSILVTIRLINSIILKSLVFKRENERIGPKESEDRRKI
jgi:hypothetical protein